MRSTKSPERTFLNETSGGALLLKALKQCKVNVVFITSGSEYGSLHADYSTNKVEATPARLLLCPYEATAVSMAHGYYLSTGRAQATLVHTTPGTANALGGIMSAYRSRVPIIMIAGVTPFMIKGHPGARRIYVHWGQDCRDQGELVRQYVKWDYLVRTGEQIPEAISRAYEIATEDPPGPVYVAIPREWLMSKIECALPSTPNKSSSSAASEDFVDKIVQMITEAERPMILTRSLGKSASAVETLIEVAEIVGARVEGAVSKYMNFPTTHPLSAPSELSKADFILAVETDIPWFPCKASPSDLAFKAYAGYDALNSQYTIWGFKFDIGVSCNPGLFLNQIKKKLLKVSSPSMSRNVEERLIRAKKDLDVFKRHLVHEAESDLSSGKITKSLASYLLGKVKSKYDIIVNEYCLRSEFVDFEVPGTFYGAPDTSNLGWGVGAALGVKMGTPDKNVIVVEGDGAYLLNNPLSVLYVSSWYNLPIMTVIFNDGCWGAIKEEVVEFTGDKRFWKSHNVPGVDFPSRVSFGQIAKSLGVATFVPKNARSIMPDFKRAYAELLNGKQTLVEINVNHGPF